MHKEHIASLARLKEQLQKLPGVGPRGAERMAFHLLREPRSSAAQLAQAILDVKDKIVHCSICHNLTESDPCEICRDPGRERSVIWVVEQPQDVLMLESTGLIRGLYHVLMGHVAPLEGVGPENLTIDSLVERVRTRGVQEVVLALNPTLEGDATALHIQERLGDSEVRITRLARGLAVGSQLEYASLGMLESAIRGRTPM
jgi:recombination protein RecR